MTLTYRSLPDAVQEAIQETVGRKAGEIHRDLSLSTLTDRVRDLLAESFITSRAQYVADGDWYGRAHELCTAWAGAYNLPVRVVAGVLAVTSPQTSWTRNRLDAHTIIVAEHEHSDVPIPLLADRLLDAQHNGGALLTQPKRIIIAALSMLRYWDVPDYLGNGPKVRSFYDNIRDPETSMSVTVDTHMIRALLDDADMPSGGDVYKATLGCKAPSRKALGYSDGLYPYFAQAIRDAARRADLLPHQAQAIAWCQWRRAQGAWGGTVDRDPVYLSPAQIRVALG